ncbi:alpha/beta hydrolase [Actinoplanes sp. TBRC 11911]|uniref:alpha/beta hydrolase family protein n=1 Tax=Actinoplanes sp. TBRC 11911 TaxID=2729386 RepID=UPI00145DE41B|nr:alpha/beta hydrolase [Actinoplanes sp. TBRC 11911]NMO50597.1 alpha/beta hydrolase [Actinoplanes sp. TBRC 11911]
MGTRRVGGMFLAVFTLLGFASCSGRPVALPVAARPPMPVAAAARPPENYPVGLRVLRLQRGQHRPLPTMVFYPAMSMLAVGLGPTTGLPPALGRFPLVLYSHGLSGSPQRVAATLAGWAAAGYVVAAPSYPYTHEFTRDYRRWDIVNQPDDARYVIKRMLRLAATPDDPLAGHIDINHIGAVGHSAGGYTTSGLFVKGHDPRLRSGVILSGWRAPGAFAGPPARMLFLQGTADPVVPMAKSRAAYARVPWPKSYVVLQGVSHANYLRPGQLGYRLMDPAVLRFLNETLKGF